MPVNTVSYNQVKKLFSLGNGRMTRIGRAAKALSVEFSDSDGGTEVRLIHEQLPSEESRDRHNEGWTSLLKKLEKFVGN